jgi:oxygen-dependent protoporphyrinogen oxidase
MRTQADVVVVGAGLAGMTAAYALRDSDVLVLEAEERIGGRSSRARIEGLEETIGAEGWYDLSLDSPERMLLDELGIELEPASGRDALIVGDRLIRSNTLDELAAALPLSPDAKDDFTRTWQRVNAECLALADAATAPERVRDLLAASATSWLGERHPEVTAFYRRLYATEFSSPLEILPALFLMYGLPRFGGAAAGAWGSFLVSEGGCPDIVAAMVAALPKPPVTSALVTSIDEGVVEYRQAGELRTVTASRVIVATPPRVTERLVRRLPPWKTAALAHIESHPGIEVLLTVEHDGAPGWEDLSAAWSLDTAFTIVLPSHTYRARNAGTGARRRSVIHLLSFGEATRPYFDRQSDAQVASAFESDFVRVFPEARGRVRERLLRRWSEAVTMPRVGYEEHVDALLRPLGPIHFAGDHVAFLGSGTPGGVGLDGRWEQLSVTVGANAAVRSGLRAAREVLAATRLPLSAA